MHCPTRTQNELSLASLKISLTRKCDQVSEKIIKNKSINHIIHELADRLYKLVYHGNALQTGIYVTLIPNPEMIPKSQTDPEMIPNFVHTDPELILK